MELYDSNKLINDELFKIYEYGALCKKMYKEDMIDDMVDVLKKINDSSTKLLEHIDSERELATKQNK